MQSLCAHSHHSVIIWYRFDTITILLKMQSPIWYSFDTGLIVKNDKVWFDTDLIESKMIKSDLIQFW